MFQNPKEQNVLIPQYCILFRECEICYLKSFFYLLTPTNNIGCYGYADDNVCFRYMKETTKNKELCQLAVRVLLMTVSEDLLIGESDLLVSLSESSTRSLSLPKVSTFRICR